MNTTGQIIYINESMPLVTEGRNESITCSQLILPILCLAVILLIGWVIIHS